MLSIIVVGVVILIAVVDVYPKLKRKINRAHIGDHSDEKIWKAKVLERSRLWLRHTPTVKLTDNTRLIIFDVIFGNYRRDVIQGWQEASLLLGLYECYKSSRDLSQKEEIQEYVNTRIDEFGRWKIPVLELDVVILAYAILSVDFIDHDRNKPAYDVIWQLIQSLKGVDGTVQYRRHMKDYRYVDSIGFVSPFLVRYGLLYGAEEALEMGVRQITEFNRHGLYTEASIPFHAYLVDSKLPVGLCGWGRGLGWYALGLVDAWKLLPNSHLHKETLTNAIRSFARMALRFQDENGAWHWIVGCRESQCDSSATAALAWFFANASELESLRFECVAAKENALKYLRSVTRQDGSIDFSQGDTKAIGVHSQEFDILPFTQGLVLRVIGVEMVCEPI